MPLPLERSLSDVLPVAPATSSALASPAFALEFHSPAREGRITKADRIQQALLATALNFFSHLPVELMLMIFTEVISEETSSCDYTFLYAGLYTHRRLAAVCKWWHAVIKGIPSRTGRRLYCNVNLSISTSMTPMSAGDMASMLRDYLANSGNENLNVLIDLRCAAGSLRPCALALIAQSHRWRSARIVGDLHDEGVRSALAMLTGRLPVLQTLEFGHIPATEINEATEEVDFGFLALAPVLTELFLLGPFSASLINITIPSNNIIRSFGCDGFEAYVLLDYLDEMPGLRELDFAYDDYEEDDDESADPEPVTTSLELPYLTKLILRNTAYAVKSLLIAAVSLPAIEKVIFSKDGFHVAAALTALKDRKRQRGDADGVIIRFLH